MLQHIDRWIVARDPDVVHLNCGLHDLRYNPGGNASQVSLPEYRSALDRIFKILAAQTRSRVIWATFTPINETRHQDTRPSRRYEADVDAYNRAALEVVEHYNVQINDMYTAVVTHGRDTLLKPDGLHFTEQGYALLSRQVSAAVLRVLGEIS